MSFLSFTRISTSALRLLSPAKRSCVKKAHCVGALLLGTLLVVNAAPAKAQEEHRSVEAQIFKPAMDHWGVFTVESARLVKPLQWGFKSAIHFSDNPMNLNLQGADDGGSISAIDYTLGIHVGAYVGLLSFLQLNIDMGFYRQWLGEPFDAENTNGFIAYDPDSFLSKSPPEAVAGDLRIGLKFKIFGWKGLRTAFLATGIVPLGDETVFAGEKGWAGEGKLAVSYSWRSLMAAANVGYLVREQGQVWDPVAWGRNGEKNILLEIDDELTWGIAGKWAFIPRLALGVEAYGRVPVMAQETNDLPMEVLAGLFFKFSRNMSLAVGGGAGLGRMMEHDGVKPLGRSSTWRVFATFAFSPQAARKRVEGVKDSDGDGISDGDDACPNAAEDPDGFDDTDGCPEADNDGDGINDKDDKCPNRAEDFDNFQDSDGCPEVDNDGDGIPDSKDRCINDAEDFDDYQDKDGCPDNDNDGDGVADLVDRCPGESGPASNNGCPVAGVGPTITAGKIELKQQIFFSTGKARILSPSKKVLDKLAALLQRNPQVKLVRIEGHTDSRGKKKANMRLSQRRAESVMKYLVSKGVASQRLQAVGYGDTRSIKSNDTRKGRAANRRVEFIIVRQ